MAEHLADEPRHLRPALRVDREARIVGVAEEACDRNVPEPELPEQKPGRRQLGLQIVERGGSILGQGPRDPLLVARLAPHGGTNDSLVKQAPDEMSPSRVSANSSSQRARARSFASRGSSGGSG